VITSSSLDCEIAAFNEIELDNLDTYDWQCGRLRTFSVQIATLLAAEGAALSSICSHILKQHVRSSAIPSARSRQTARWLWAGSEQLNFQQPSDFFLIQICRFFLY
jgi:hypothetical protein